MKRIYSRGGRIERPVKPRFFEYSQNNSGGSFKYDKAAGISHYVIVEAVDYRHANDIAEVIGLYFDGYGDCSCCGDRWYRQDSYDKGDEAPSHYGKPLPEEDDDWRFDHDEGEPYVFVHYLDGRVEGWE